MDNFELRRRALLKNIAVSIVKLIVTGANGIVNFTTNLIHSVKIVCDFVPIQSGTGDPSPSNVRPISGYTGCEITRTGKNMWKQSFPADVTGLYAGWFIPYNSKITITLFDKQNGADISGVYFGLSGNGINQSNGISWMIDNGTQRYTTLSNTTYHYLTIYSANENTLNKLLARFYVLVTVDDDDNTVYEAYKGNIISVIWANEAGTVYGGTLTINEDGTGRLVSEYKQISVGDLNYTLNTGLTNVDRYYVAINDSKSYGVSDLPDVICEAFKTMTLASANSTQATWAVGFQTKTVYFYVPEGTYLTVNDFKSAFASTKFVYALDTPVTYNLTASQVNSLLGTNNIWHNMNGAITVEYYNKQ